MSLRIGMFQLNKSKAEIFVLGLMYFALMIFLYISRQGFCITFTDTDDYMRVLRIKEFFTHFDLSNTIISRGNYPVGCDLHWTRLYDFFLIAFSYLCNIFVNSIEKSVECVCLCISPIFGLVSMAFIFKIFNQFMKKEVILLAVALFCASPFLTPFFAFGRPDHHAFITMCMIIYFYNFTELVLNKKDDKNIYILSAIITTCCVWASPETLIVLVLSDAVLFISYFNDSKVLRKLYFKSVLSACFIGLISSFPLNKLLPSHFFVICILLLMIPYSSLKNEIIRKSDILKSWHFVCLLFMMILLPNVHPVEYDKISVVHSTLFLCSAIYFAINAQLVNSKNHMFDAAIWAFVIGVVFLSIFPSFFSGMEADISPLIKEIWLSRIAEMKSPILSTDSRPAFVVYVMINICAITVKFQELRKQTFEGKNIIWFAFVLIGSTYLILAAFAYRMIPYSVLFGLPLVVNLGMSSKLVKGIHKIFRMLITMFLSVFFLFLTCFFQDSCKDTIEKKYTERELYEMLDSLSENPAIIMAHSNYGPPILYYTKHCVLGAPYHRQTDGILYSYIITEMDFDNEIVKKVLKKTHSDFIFIKDDKYQRDKNSFAARILKNDYPEWISVVKIPDKFSDIVVAKVNHQLLAKAK